MGTDYQSRLLEKQGYKPYMEEDGIVLYSRETVSSCYTVLSLVEIFDNENPDNLMYRGLVTIKKDEEVIAEWDSEKKYRLLDVMSQIGRIHGLLDKVIQNVA